MALMFWLGLCAGAEFATKFSREISFTTRQAVALKATGIKIDGKLDERFWLGAEWYGGFFELGKRQASRKETLFSVGYDDKNLYFAIVSEEPELDKLKGKPETKRDTSQWAEDCVEVFVQSRSKSQPYHIILTAFNTVWDGIVLDRKWNPSFEHATGKGKGFWTAELAIPFTELGETTPLRGDVWKLRIAREDYVSESLSTWDYIASGSFITPTLGGELIFESRNLVINSGFEEGGAGSSPLQKGHGGLSSQLITPQKPRATTPLNSPSQATTRTPKPTTSSAPSGRTYPFTPRLHIA